MRGPIRSILLAALAACALAATTAVQASAAVVEAGTTAVLAIYGNPGNNGAAVPVGGGLGRNFGFGTNMLFQADHNVLALEEDFHFNISGEIIEVGDTYIGGTLMSNTTGSSTIGTETVENPVSFTIQFVDFQEGKVGASLVPWFTDTSDRPWITEICGELANCKVDGRQVGGQAFEVKIEDVAFSVGPGVVVQGTVWGEWSNGTAAKPPCIKFTKAPTAALEFDELVETQGPAVGAKPNTIGGTACLVSANNYFPPVTTVVKIK